MSKKPNATPQEDRSGGRGIEITTTTSFDYSLLPDDVANEAKEVAAEFRAFEARTVEGLAEIGRRLIRVRDRVERGKFLRWVEAEFPNAKSTAYRMMDVAENLASDELPTMGSLPPTTIYQLAAPGTPAPLRQGIIARLKSGERIPPPQIKHMVREARKADRKAKEEARLSPKEKKKRGEREKSAALRRGKEGGGEVAEGTGGCPSRHRGHGDAGEALQRRGTAAPRGAPEVLFIDRRRHPERWRSPPLLAVGR